MTAASQSSRPGSRLPRSVSWPHIPGSIVTSVYGVIDHYSLNETFRALAIDLRIPNQSQDASIVCITERATDLLTPMIPPTPIFSLANSSVSHQDLRG